MAPASPPHIGMFVRIPIGRRRFDCFNHLLPRLETPPLERERAERFPPGFNQVQVRGTRGLEDKLPAGIGQIKEQDVDGPVHRQIIQHGVDPLHILRDPGLYLLQEVDPVDLGAPGIARGEHLPTAGLKRSEDVACLLSPAIVNLLLGSLGWC